MSQSWFSNIVSDFAVFDVSFQAELKVAEYNKLGRKLKLIPQSAENACGHDFEIRTDNGATTITQYKTQIQVQSCQPSTTIKTIYNTGLTRLFVSLVESSEEHVG